VTHARTTSARTRGRIRVAAVLAVIVGSLISAAPASGFGPRAALDQVGEARAAASELGSPSIQYEEARAHAADPNLFRPGGPSTVLLRARTAPPSPPHGVISATTASSIVPSNSGLRREVFGFLPYWELNDSSLVLNYGTLSTIAYFSVGVDGAGNLIRTNSDGSVSTGWGGWTSAALTNVINAAHQQGVRVVLSLTLFGWSSTEAATQGAMLGSATARVNLAAQAARAVADRGADGVNLDFEPIVSGHSADFTALIRAIRSQLDAVVPGAQLTFDATAQVGNYPVADATGPGGADAIFIMGYDYRTAGALVAGSISPLNGPIYDVGDTIAAYLARAPASKLILGIPYYGRAWSTKSDAGNAPTQSGTKFGSSTSATYSSALDLVAQYGRRYDPIEDSPWTAYQKQNCTSTYGCVTTWRELYFDDAQSLRAKYDLVNRAGLRGVGIWALGYDGPYPELTQALGDKFVNDTTPPLAGIVVLPSTAASESIQVSWTAIDDWSGISAIDVQVSVDGSPWAPWLTGSTQTSATYTGATGHSFAFRVRATDGLGHVSDWNVLDSGAAPAALSPGGFAQVAVDGLAVRAGPDPNAQRVATLNTGGLVAITGGPLIAGGYTWYQVSEPIREWRPVSPVLVGVWVAASSGSTPYLTAVRPPNSTFVAATGPDTTPPTLSARISGPLFVSPNGDGVLDTVQISGNALGATTWTLLISPAADPAGAPVRTIAGAGETIAASWDGRADNQATLPDGPYRLRLEAGDAAGNKAGQEWIVQLDVTPPAPQLVIAPSTLSPNGDRYAETTTARWAGGDFIKGVLAILKSSTVIRSVPVSAGTTGWTWDGRDKAGRGVSDGFYTIRLTLVDAAGNAGTSRSVATVDRTASLLRWSPTRFKPSRGGLSSVSYSLSRTATVTLLVRGPDGKSVRTAWSNRVQRAGLFSWAWDGHDGKHRAVAPGNYVAVLAVRTKLGVTTIMRTVVVV
jgi:spore germination protein YaaH/flagellar hook assembly protein FlgD